MAEPSTPDNTEEVQEMMKKLDISDVTPNESPIIEGGIYPLSYFDQTTYPTNMNIIAESDGENSYCGIDGTQFKVRGPNYLKDKKKFVSQPSITRLRGCDMNMMKEKPLHWCSRADSLPAKAKAAGSKDFFFVYNIVVTYKKKFISLCQYHTIPNDLEQTNPTAYRMIQKLINDDDDKWKTKHIKLIPTVVHGPGLVKKCVGSVPCIIGKKLKQLSYKGDNYIEIDMDVSHDKMISSMCEMCFKMAKSVVMDLGFVLEATEVEDLPEQVLSSIRLCRPDLTTVPML